MKLTLSLSKAEAHVLRDLGCGSAAIGAHVLISDYISTLNIDPLLIDRLSLEAAANGVGLTTYMEIVLNKHVETLDGIRRNGC